MRVHGQSERHKNLHNRYFLLLWSRDCEKLSFQARSMHVYHHHQEYDMDAAPSGKETWQEMLNNALEGDMEQFGRLCQEHLRPKLYPFALTLLKNQDDANDIVQEAFARLLTHYQNIRNRDLKGFEAFVMKMVKNLCRDLWKKHKPTGPLPEDRATSTTPQEEFARKQMLTSLCFTIQQELTEDEQQIFEMKALDELPYRSIAEYTGISQTTAYNYYQNILLKIKQHGELREYWEEMNNYSFS